MTIYKVDLIMIQENRLFAELKTAIGACIADDLTAFRPLRGDEEVIEKLRMFEEDNIKPLREYYMKEQKLKEIYVSVTSDYSIKELNKMCVINKER